MYALGLMSGTSADGIDVALVHIEGTGYDLGIKTLETRSVPYTPTLQAQVLAVGGGAPLSALAFGALHRDLGEFFAQAALTVLKETKHCVAIIGSHGQTVAHQPPQGNQRGFSLQLGDGAVIAQSTGIKTVSNFRSRDLAAGGHGAPLVPLLDWILCRDAQEDRCIHNIGGIANVTYLAAGADQRAVIAFDTGPGNMLLDALVRHFTQGALTYDQGGNLARQGQIHPDLLAQLLADDFLKQPPPKSTGREYYGWQFLDHWLQRFSDLDLKDYLATFTAFTAHSMVRSYRDFLPRLPQRVLICGGGVHNQFLLSQIQGMVPEIVIDSTQVLGLDPDYKEAICFAILAYLRVQGLPGNLPQVTQGTHSLLLGDIHEAI